MSAPARLRNGRPPLRSDAIGDIERKAEGERERFCELVFLGRKLESDVALSRFGQAARFNLLPQAWVAFSASASAGAISAGLPGL